MGGLLAGAGMELFMVKVWIGKTNFYETVKEKEAARRAGALASKETGELSFGEIVKKQWEEKKKEMESKKQQEAR